MLGVLVVYRVSRSGRQRLDHGVARLVCILVMNYDDGYVARKPACQFNHPRDVDACDVGCA